MEGANNRNINVAEFQKRVMLACLIRNTTISQLAKQFGTSRQALYYAIHTGTMGIPKLLALADVLDVSVDWLLGRVPLEIKGVNNL